MSIQPKTLPGAMAELRESFRTAFGPQVEWLGRNAWWLRIAGGAFLAGLAVDRILGDDPFSAGLIGLVLIWAYWPLPR